MASSMRNGTVSERIATARFLFETLVPVTRADSSFSTHASIRWFNEQPTACGCPSVPRGILPTSLRIRIDTTAYTGRPILPSKYASAHFISGIQCIAFAAFLFNSITIITIIGQHQQQQLTSHLQSFTQCFFTTSTCSSTTFRWYYVATFVVIIDTGLVE